MPSSCPHCLREVPEGFAFCGHCGSPSSAGDTRPAPFPDASGGPRPRLPGRYRIVRFLGRGGMGRVYLCEDQDLQVEVAVKVLPAEFADDPEAVKAIEREARLAARLRGGPGILTLYGFERHEGASLLVMEYAEGGSLFARIRSHGTLPEEECRRLGAAMADALAFAHERRVLHRDVKPANVLLTGKGDTRVADFGLARVLAETSSRLSGPGLAGTPVYLPPEVIEHRTWEPRGDLYSLGCVLYEMATGAPPFAGTFAEMAIEKARPEGRPPDPRERLPGLSDDYAAAVRCLLARDPVERYPDAATVASVLRGAPAGPAAPTRREPLLLDLPVEPAVPGLPPPSHPALDTVALPEGFRMHGGRLWSLRDGAEMAFVPGGEFTMGSDRGLPDESPSRRVRLSPFLVDRHEVTVYQYARYCRETGRALPEQPRGSGDRHPVVNVTWDEARAYAQWAGRDLPTEAQWEKAARGADARDYPWGQAPPDADHARFRDPGAEGTSSVGAYPSGRSPFGCLDMVGNAWEWCADWYAPDYYAAAPDHDPVGPPEGSSRVLRGGAWNDPPDRLRCTRRRRSRPESRYDFVGFRCVKDLPPDA